MEYKHNNPNVFELSIGNVKHRISIRRETMATALELLRTKPKSKYPLCYCKLCQGETQRGECPNRPNPHPPLDSTWFRALRGEPISVVGEK